MQVLERSDELAEIAQSLQRSGNRVGLVPTMGFLHRGHLSLVERARTECDSVVVTIFVNPLQFGEGEDFDVYPRDVQGDLTKLEDAGVDFVFVPTVEQMYPEPVAAGVSGATATTVLVRGISELWEGASRPGHFEGVATVVAKLFALVGRCRAYFGDKDYQQLLLIRRMARDLLFPVEVVGCSTIREPDGLALSSRNVRLSGPERRAACVLSRALLDGARDVQSGETRPRSVVEKMQRIVLGEPLASLEYAAAVDAWTLEVPEKLVGDVRLIIAARVGSVRLIDNVGVIAPTTAEVSRIQQGTFGVCSVEDRELEPVEATVLVGVGQAGEQASGVAGVKSNHQVNRQER